MTDTALETTKPAPMQAMDPMQMIQVAFQTAIEKGEGLAVVDRILEQQRQMMVYRDTEAFNAALQRIQAKLKPIAKLGWNPETKSKFATSESIDDVIESLLQEECMSLSFEPESHPQPEMMRIVGVLSLGPFSKRYPLDMPADGKGAKGGGVMSRTHATGSAITYGKRYLKNMIFNLRFKEKDDDGNRAGKGGGAPGALDDKKHIELLTNIENAPSIEDLKRLYFLAIGAAQALEDKTSEDAFVAAKNKRQDELNQKRGTA